MSPVGVLGRLEVSIKHKAFSAATGGNLRVIDGLDFSLGKGEVGGPELVGPARALDRGTFYRPGE